MRLWRRLLANMFETEAARDNVKENLFYETQQPLAGFQNENGKPARGFLFNPKDCAKYTTLFITIPLI